MKKIRLTGFICLLLFPIGMLADEPKSNAGKAIDATAHVLVSGAFTFSSCVIVTRLAPEMKLFPKYLISASVGMLPGVLKEIYDSYDADNKFDPLDIGWNALGAGGGILLHYFLFDINKTQHAAMINFNPKNGLQLAYSYRF